MQKEQMKFGLLALGCATDTIICDQISKWLVVTYIKAPYYLVEPWAYLWPTRNTGIAFSLPLTGWLAVMVSLLVVGYLGYLAYDQMKRNFLAVTTVGLIIGGALSNVIDRVRLGGVIDFIVIGKWPSFNLADTAIVVGVLLVLVFNRRIFREQV